MSNSLAQKQVVVIGAGVGGLATAALLAKQGARVLVFEKNSSLGGRVSVTKSQGFTFEMGPSWYLLPSILEDFFTQFGHKSSDFYRLARLKERAQIFFDDQSFIVPQAQNDLESLFENWEQNGGVKLRQLLGKSARMLQILKKSIFQSTFDQRTDYFKLETAKALWQLQLITNQFQTWSQLVNSHFSSAQSRQLLNQLFLPIGKSSQEIPVMYGALLAAQFRELQLYPMGGFGEVIRGIAQVGWEQGVATQTGEVEQIVVKNDCVSGVTVGGEFVPADVVVANTDFGYLQSELLPSGWRDERFSDWQSKKHTQSVIQICLGLKKKLPLLKHHNFFITDSRQTNILWGDINLETSATMYCVVPSQSDWQVAPTGGENLRIILPISSQISDTAALRQKIATQVIQQFEKKLQTTISDSIAYIRVVANQQSTVQFNSTPASMGGLALTFDQMLWKRPSQSSKLRGLFTVGHSLHPGAGIPLVLSGASQCATKVIADLNLRSERN